MKFYWLLLFGLILNSCARHTPDVPPTPVLTFNQDIQSIIVTNCAYGCHDGRGELRKLETYSEVMRHVKSGKPYQSNLFTVMVNLSYNRMPPAGNMSDANIRKVYIWILQGAKE